MESSITTTVKLLDYSVKAFGAEISEEELSRATELRGKVNGGFARLKNLFEV
jgi:hypothetical protein